ncbi:MAG: DUF615 domain-containing protein [Gammaproteobacteria bacterium]|nr:DUF615 domain-containing protein [Gammaproteobacteria bacterium]
MKHQTEAQISDDQNDIDENEDWVSKSQLKRDSKDLQSLGKKLASFNAEQLAKVPLNDKMLDAIELAQKLSSKRGALKRHFQFIGKILRSIDVEPILAAVQAIEDTDNSGKLIFKKMEYWRDRIVTEGDPAIDECCDKYHNMDRQKLRQLSRNLKKAPSEEKKIRFARQIFQEIQAVLKIS